MKLVALDTLNLIHRAFHAIPSLSTSRGIPTNAVLGFLNILLKLLEEENPDYIVSAFDFPGPSFRHESYAPYKAHRPPSLPELSLQVSIVREVLKGFGIRIVEMEGFEADDVLAALARQAGKEGIESLVVSNDRDLLQIVDDKVHVLSSGRRLDETILYTRQEVEKRLGLTPEQVPDLKSLMGDPSDNIPGISGIGEKTAVRLLQAFGSLEGIYSRLEEVNPINLRETLAQQKDSVFRARDLVRLRPDLDLQLPLQECESSLIDWPGAMEVLRKYEFQRLMERIGSQEKFDDLPPLSGEHTVISEPADMNWLRQRLSQTSLISLVAADETEGVSLAICPCSSEVLAAAGAGADEEVAMLSLARVERTHPHPPSSQGSLFELSSALSSSGGMAELAQRLLEEASDRLTVHDAKAVSQVLDSAGMTLLPPSFDTFLASYLLEPGRQAYPLAELCRRLLGHDLAKPAEGAEPEGDRQAPQTFLASQARCLARITPILRQQVEENGLLGLLQKLEIPLSFILAEMELAGVKLDVAGLRLLSERFEEKISALEAEICRLAGRRFNVASTKQLQQVLYSELGLKGTKKTKTGFSTDLEALERIANRHPIVPLILEHRTFSKLKSTYADALPQAVNPATGRVHTTFNQAGTATGRLSSSNPNLQNIPARTEVGTEIRRCFIAEEGNLLLSADYSQIELRLLAHLSQEPLLLKFFSGDGDVHTETACTIFNVAVAGVTPEMRRQAKTVNFGIIYGIGARALAAQLKIPEEQAQALINDYFRKFSRVREYLEATKDEVRKLGYAVTVLGRKRTFPDISSPDRQVRAYAERAAINSPLQGSAADVIKLAMVNMKRQVLPNFPGARMILQVHDELLFELPAGQVRVFAREVQMAMESAYPLCIPLKADVKAGKNWGEMAALV